MTKIVYIVTTIYIEEEIQEVAEKAGVTVAVKQVSREIPEEELRALVAEWEEMGTDILLCRGGMEGRIKKIASRAYVLGIRFSFDTVLLNLNGYKRQNPEFFTGRIKRVLMVSRRRLPLNAELLRDLFHVEAVNVSAEEFDTQEDFLKFGEGFDLVISGQSWIPYWKERGVRCFYQRFTEKQSLEESFIQAIILADSRRQLQEKNEEIQNLLDNSFHAVIVVNQEGIIARGNGQLRKYFKHDLHGIVGKNIYTFLPGLKKGMLEEIIRMGKEFYGELMEFDDRVLVMNGFPIRQKGEIAGAALNFEELHKIEQVEQKIKTELYNKGLVARYRFQDIVGQSDQMLAVKEYDRGFASHNSNILLYGESGTGKELFAQSIHNSSLRKNGPFVAVNCGALPSNLLESELFGYVGGAFTGAFKGGKKGLLELAHKGTIFLDEISEMEAMGQVRLLRVLEERVISRIGDDKVIPVDIRIITASNKNLKKMVEEGKFREDLYYRLNVLMLKIPPLRERRGDIALLTDRFLQQFGEASKKQVELSPQAKKVMEGYLWKGNVRQLRNFCERLVIIADTRVLEGDFVRRQLEDSYFEALGQERGPERNRYIGEEPVREEMQYFGGPDRERRRILEALNRSQGRRQEAAEYLGISKTSLWRKMKKYGIAEKY